MNSPYTNARLFSSWFVQVMDAPSGKLELYETDSGFAWFWKDKPRHLVPLNGVPDDVSVKLARPWRFAEVQDAVEHVLHCTGTAYYGRCGLTAAH